MDNSRSEPAAHETWSDAIDRRLQAQRQCAKELLDEQLERVRAIECSLVAEPTAIQDIEDDGYRARYEMALEDLRELKRSNAELQKTLESRKAQGTGGSSSNDDDPHAMDWEAQKRRLLAQLEAEGDELAPRERLTMQGLVQQTNEVIAAKDNEIQGLKQLLEDQSHNLGHMAVGAAAIGQIVQSDDLVRQERESLQKIQDEWREKLRKAEVEISLERAKIARERAKLDEKMRDFERERVHLEAALAEAESSGKPIKKTGRWLAQLGISRDDD